METEDDGDSLIRNAENGHWIATLEDCHSEGEHRGETAETKLECLGEEEGPDGRLAKRIR